MDKIQVKSPFLGTIEVFNLSEMMCRFNLKLLVFIGLSTCFFSVSVMAQNVGINATGSNPDNSAMLDVDSRNQGILIPRLTKAERNSIVKPANGLMLYQLDDTVGFWFYDINKWKPIFQNVTAGAGLTGGKIVGYGTVELSTTAVSSGTYGYPDSIPQFTVNQYGQLVFAKNLPFAEKDAVIGNEVTDTSGAYGMLTINGFGSSASPLTMGINPGQNFRDIWFWNGTTWALMSLPYEQDSIIGNEITDTTLARGMLIRTGTGTSTDPYKIGVESGLKTGDVWMWNGSKWVSGNITYPNEKDSLIGNEVSDTSNSNGMLNRFGNGTSASPLTIGINPGGNVGDIWMWNGSKWIASKFTIPTEQDSVIGNEVKDTINSRGILNLYGSGTSANPLKMGIEPGKNVGEVWMWDGSKWESKPIIHPAVTIPNEKDSVIGNEVADTINSRGILNIYGSGSAVSPLKIGVEPGTNSGDVWTWNGSKWTSKPIIHPSVTIPKEQDSVIGNEISDTTQSKGVLLRFGSGTLASPYKIGISSGSTIGDVWMWNGSKWASQQIIHPTVTIPKEKDSVIGNEISDTIQSKGVLLRFGSGTLASPYKIGISSGSTIGDVWMWNGSKWTPKQITHPTEVDGIIGNEVADTITNGFLQLTGAGTAANPRKMGLKPASTAGHVLVWDGTKWIPQYFPKNTLDKAYDEGGAGVGRVINADAGAVEINGTDGFLVTGSYGSGSAIGSPGAGTRMFFNPRTASFRAGRVTGTEWDAGNSGAYSFATGLNTTAKGNYSLAMGANSKALANHSIAIGDSARANNSYSIAIGDRAQSDGQNAIAIGDSAWAYGQNSLVIGRNSHAEALSGVIGELSYANARYAYVMGYRDTAKGDYSIAIGHRAFAEGVGSIALGSYVRTDNPYSIAIGNNVYAIADNSVAMGSYVSTNFKNGSFVFGDNSTTTLFTSTVGKEMAMRFAGGYRLFTNSSLSTGVYMASNASGWTNYSDRNMKENFETLDGEEILASIDKIEISKWNYKNSDPNIKYIGPMAQDFYKQFKLGGSDSLGINSVSIDGVNMAAIQALVKRTENVREMERQLALTNQMLLKQQEELEILRKQIELLLQQNNKN